MCGFSSGGAAATAGAWGSAGRASGSVHGWGTAGASSLGGAGGGTSGATAGGVQILSSYRVAVVNTGADYLVLSLVCPHQGGAVTSAGTGFYCSRHGAEWTKDGQWVGGQPTTNLARIASRFDAATGVLTIG